MATTKIWAVRSSLADALDYVKNPAKCAFDYITSDGKKVRRLLMSGINCDAGYAFSEMQDVKTQFGKCGGILAHHAEQSFKPGEIAAEEAHRLGVEFAEKMWGDRFQAIVCTHTDKAHIHNHYIINSVSFIDGKKYDGCKKAYRKLREVSDGLCRENALSVVERPVDKGRNLAEIHIEKTGKASHRQNLKDDIDYAISKSGSMDEFYSCLRSLGYQIKSGKHTAVSAPGAKRYIRLRSLKDEAYMPDGIRRRIAEHYNRNFGVIYKGKRTGKTCRKPKMKMEGYKALYVRYLFALGKIPGRRSVKPSYHTVRQIRRLNGISRQTRLIFLNGIENEGDLRKHENYLRKRYAEYEQLRTEKRKEARRVLPEAEISKIKNDIANLTEEMKKIRRELSVCKDIARAMSQPQSFMRKDCEVKRNEHGRRFRGNDRQDDP